MTTKTNDNIIKYIKIPNGPPQQYKNAYYSNENKNETDSFQKHVQFSHFICRKKTSEFTLALDRRLVSASLTVHSDYPYGVRANNRRMDERIKI